MVSINSVYAFSSYFFILNLIYNPLDFNLTILVLPFFIFFFLSRDFLLILPFIIYPFHLLLRNNFSDSIVVKILPEIIFFFVFIRFFSYFKAKFFFGRVNIFFFLLMILIILSYFYHLEFNFYQFFYYAKIYVLPLIFLIFFFTISINNNNILNKSFKFSIISYFVISILTLLNYTEITLLSANLKYLHKYVYDSLTSLPAGRFVNFFDFSYYVKRLNILHGGGSVGSSAAILLSLSLSFLFYNKNFNFINIFMMLTLAVVSLLSISFSILIVIIYFIFFRYVIKKTSYILLLSAIIFFILFYKEYIFLGQRQGIYYILDVIFLNLNFIYKFDFYEFLFGKGPNILNLDYQNYVNIPIDSGIFRIFFEFGAIVFLIYLIIIIYPYLVFIKNDLSKESCLFIFLYTVLISLIHGNIPMSSPYFLLFSVYYCSIANHSKIKQKI
jgi:hypothetical protein